MAFLDCQGALDQLTVYTLAGTAVQLATDLMRLEPKGTPLCHLRSLYHNKETLETIFYCCAVLHNMNHHYDCYDEKVHDADELQELLSFQNNPQPNEEPVGTVYGNCKDFVARRIALINHFVYCRDELDKKFADHRSFS